MKGVIVGIVVVLALLLFLSMDVLAEAVLQLIFGWLPFLFTELPRRTVSWADTFIAAVCLAGLAVGLHLFLGWLHRALTQPAADHSPISRWPWRWTGKVLTLILLAILAGISAVGVTHQTAWLLTSPDPLTHASGGTWIESVNNLRQMGLGLHNYHTHRKGRLPASTFDAHGNGRGGWQVAMLPYLEHETLYKSIDHNAPWNDPGNAPAFSRPVVEYLHPGVRERVGEGGYALSHYAANVRVLGGDRPRNTADVTDGLANTLMSGEVWAEFRPWGYPANWRDPARGIHTTPDSFGSPSRDDVAVFAFMDGSVRPVNKSVGVEVLKALSTPAGGEDIKPDDW